VGGTWVPLLDDAEGRTGWGFGSLGHDKYSTERFFPFLVIDPEVRLNSFLSAYRTWRP
jgi:hypothetical protein